MELRHLRYFVAAAEELHIRRAAARLRIAQPALSRQIRQLEEEIGVELLRREKRRIALTPAGALFMSEARRILASADHAVTVARASDRGEVGELSIGFVGSATFGILPGIVKRFRHRSPGIRLSLRELATNEQVKALHEGALDVGFLRARLNDRSLSTRIVAREPLVAALPRSHPLAEKAQVRLAQLAAEPFILFPRALGPDFFDQIVGACRNAGFSPKVVQEAIQMATIVSFVATGLGVSLVPAALRNFCPRGVVYKALVPPQVVELSMVWRSDNANATVARFVENTFKL